MAEAADIYAAIARYQGSLSEQDFARLCETAEVPAGSAVRANLLKVTDPAAFLHSVAQKYGWQVKPVPFAEHALQIRSAHTPPGQTLEHRLGCFYVQDAASMLPAALFSSIEPGQLLLDMAASPGGKTTQLVDRLRDRGLVMANDSSTSRLPALRAVLATWGAASTLITPFAGEKLGDWFPDTFDRVLLDAPCSMEGLRQSASHPFRPITASERSRLSERQLALLISALKAARPDGEVVYSTCTLAPEEDEMILDALLKAFPESVRIEPITGLAEAAPALTEFEGSQFKPEVAHSLRLWPFTFGTNGFFAARLRKTGPLPHSGAIPPARDFSLTGLRPVSAKEERLIADTFSTLYGLDLAQLLEANLLRVFVRGQNLMLLPVRYLERFMTLPYHALGMPLGRLIGPNFEPAVEFISRFGQLCPGNIWTLPAELQPAWLAGSDLRGVSVTGCQPGSIVIVRDEQGLILGAGKLNPGRLRNLLPHRNLITA